MKTKLGKCSAELLVSHMQDVYFVKVLETWLHKNPPRSNFSPQVLQNRLEKRFFLLGVDRLRLGVIQIGSSFRVAIELLLNLPAKTSVVD